MYPANARPTIMFDEEGVCSGCRYHESREKLEIDWDQRLKIFEQIVEEMIKGARQKRASHECIIPVSGGKDSHFQVWLLKKKYGLNPLLVTYNHAFNSPAGLRNLDNLISKSGCDLVRYTAGLDSVRRVSRHMLKTVGDITWHYHAGIRTLPFQVSVAYKIPWVVWGEHGYAELTGLVTLEDFVEFTKWTRKEHDMRGYEAEDLIGRQDITERDIGPYVYPSDEDIARNNIRGIYLSNFFYWDAKRQAEHMIKEWNFGAVTFERERTFNLYGKIEDHANDVHDYLKYLKFGYGRATDDASTEIRHGRMTREEGMRMVERYDATTPSTLEYYCDFLGITKDEFYKWVEPMRESRIWEKRQGAWCPTDAVYRHAVGGREDAARAKQSTDRTFSEANRQLYYNSSDPPRPTGERELDEMSGRFLPH
jgi:N-acetyl sugar amidotransferase